MPSIPCRSYSSCEVIIPLDGLISWEVSSHGVYPGIRPCVVEGEDNAPTLGHFMPCGGPVSKGALLGVF
ncbi:hypothetical protein HanPI659440_Chr12g0478231 [Helianthus annuus]|nr:hypothetical protein HanPI659440_Chr12g0478231 [Helianthus annuus]